MARRKRKNSKPTSKVRRTLGILALVVLLWPLYILGGKALCHIALDEIAGLTNTRIRTESVRFHANGSVRIRGLSVSPSEEDNTEEPIFRAEEVGVRFSLLSFLSFNPKLRVIDVSDFEFNALYDLDEDRWNLSALKVRPPRGNPDRMPRIRLKSGILRYGKTSDDKVEVAVSMPLDAEFGIDEKVRDGYKFEVVTATQASGYGQSRLTGTWKSGSLSLTGGIASVDVPGFEMAWIIDVMAAGLTYDKNGAYELKLRVDNLRSVRNPVPEGLVLIDSVSPGRSSPFAALQRFFDQYQPSGLIDVDLDASGSLNRLGESTLTGMVVCKDVAICYHKFQYAIEGIAGLIDFTNSSADLRNLSGRHGNVGLSFNGWSKGLGPDWKYMIRITSDRMPLDSDLYDALSPKQQEFWAAFSPAGYTAIDYQFLRESPSQKQRKLTAEPRGAEATYCSFPYPLKGLTGKLSFDHDKVVFSDLVSQVGDEKIVLNGEVTTSDQNKRSYELTARVDNVPLDSTLRAALPQKQKDMFDQFDPSGLVSGSISISAQDGGPPSFIADLSFQNASLKSDTLALPVTDISARATFSPDSVDVEEFSGRYHDGSVSMAGRIRSGEEQGRPLYNMSVVLEDIELNDDLFKLLPESTRKMVAEWNPAGRVNITADLNNEDSSEYPDCKLTLKCLGNTVSLPKLPHPLKDVRGTLAFDGDVIRLSDVSAILDCDPPDPNREPTVNVSGEVKLRDGAFEDASLNVLAADILMDEQLARALPRRARSWYDDSASPGTFDLDLKNVRIRRANEAHKSVDFAGGLRLKGCSLKVSGATIVLDSSLETTGRYETGHGFSACRTTLNGGTLNIWGKTLTNISSDVLYDPNQTKWSTEHLVADFYGGKLKGKFVLDQSAQEPAQYVLQTGFDNVNLKQFLADTSLEQSSENGHTTGQMDGSLSVSARIGEISSRIGACKLSITDMQVGKLSPLAKLLVVLQLTAPEDFAFNRMLVDSYIRQASLIVKTLDLSGRTHAFSGSGKLNLQDLGVDLTLTARGQRLATDDPSVLQSLTEGLGQAVVRMDVTGDLRDPKVTTEALPVIGKTLEILGAKPPKSN